jgi:dephospho-CoA kinase
MNRAIKELIIAHLFNDDMKEKMISKINDSVDIPLLRESTEEKVFSAIWDCVEDSMKSAILED